MNTPHDRTPASSAAQDRRSVPLMEGLRNLEKGYDRKFALSYCADEVWAALEALEAIDTYGKRLRIDQGRGLQAHITEALRYV